MLLSKPGIGTREAPYCVQILLQKCREFRKQSSLALDKVQRSELVESLKKTDLARLGHGGNEL